MLNRNRILRALYTLLLGNPQLRPGQFREPETRFKTWWSLVGSAVEHAAGLLAREGEAESGRIDGSDETRPVAIRFRDLFNNFEAEEEQTSALAGILEMLREHWPYRFRAVDIARFIEEKAAGLELKSLIEQATSRADDSGLGARDNLAPEGAGRRSRAMRRPRSDLAPPARS